MNVAGIDVSTRAIDIVKLGFDTDQATWNRYELQGDTALTRATSAADGIAIGSYWDDVALVAIERPFGPGRDTTFALHLVIGILIAKLPIRLRPPWLLHPAEWRKACGLNGHASKREIEFFAAHHTYVVGWSQDACDAYCIATAARNINQKGQAA